MIFTSPALLISSTLATMWAALFHLLLGRSFVDLVLYWFVGLIGFAIGQGIAEALGFHWLLVGQVHIIEGTLCCWIAMLVARWLKV
ncbi:MAG: hypothetical protein J7M05_06270 [Anaerolineae bacterium]|nr:hypothetical protein [Anaerolineae bacterium]